MYKKTINVLLSTYNGEKYLQKQIESILAQSNVEVQIFIRDDGSTDGSIDILKQYEFQRKIHIVYGENIGWRRSFFKLVESVPYSAGQFYAFSDQDDIWQPLKLVKAVDKLGNAHYPTVYHSNMTLVDSAMNFVSYRYPKGYSPNTKMPNAFFDGVGTGATIVFNSVMLHLLQQYAPTKATAHDAYIVALGNLLGKVIYDSDSYILYRRHSSTATGFGKKAVQEAPSLAMRFKRYRKSPSNPYSIRADMILSGYGKKISSIDHQLLKRISSYQINLWSRLYLLFSPKIRASGLRKTLQIKYRVIFGTL